MHKLTSYTYLVFLSIVLFSCTGKKSIEGDQYYENGQYEQALESYSKFLKIYPRNLKTLYNRAMTYQQLGREEEAIADFTKLLKLSPRHLEARIALGELKFARADYEGAYYEFDQAVNVRKNSSLAHLYRAKALQMLGEFRKAKKDYGIAIRLDANNGVAYFYRGTLEISQKKKKAACNDFRKAQTLGVKEAEQALAKYCK